MTSIHEHPALTPAQLTQKLIRQAREQAERDEWQRYEEENRRHLDYLRSRGRRTRKPIEHGHRGYRRGCRCDECRRGHADYMRERNRKIREADLKPKNQPKGRAGRTVKEEMHGTLTGYSYGCRCDECRRAKTYHRPKRSTTHGTAYAYKKKRCRCMKCIKAQRERWRRDDQVRRHK